MRWLRQWRRRREGARADHLSPSRGGGLRDGEHLNKPTRERAAACAVGKTERLEGEHGRAGRRSALRLAEASSFRSWARTMVLGSTLPNRVVLVNVSCAKARVARIFVVSTASLLIGRISDGMSDDYLEDQALVLALLATLLSMSGLIHLRAVLTPFAFVALIEGWSISGSTRRTNQPGRAAALR